MKPIDELSDEEFSLLVRRAAALPDAPAAWLRAAIDQWPAPPSRLEAAAKAAFKRVAAALSFDSWSPGELASGMRAVPSNTRHLLFSALGRDIDVRIAPTAVHSALTGQILGPDESGLVELASATDGGGSADARVVTLDALGEFRIEGIPDGTYVLTVRFAEDEIVLPPIDVGERRS
ncbi:MAG: carboxypeptidase-like regulatory domain-containing protein [Betaproteobacteria bacterium]